VYGLSLVSLYLSRWIWMTMVEDMCLGFCFIYLCCRLKQYSLVDVICGVIYRLFILSKPSSFFCFCWKFRFGFWIETADGFVFHYNCMLWSCIIDRLLPHICLLSLLLSLSVWPLTWCHEHMNVLQEALYRWPESMTFSQNYSNS